VTWFGPVQFGSVQEPTRVFRLPHGFTASA